MSATTPLHEDPRVIRGMEAQLALRRELLDAGARPIGWKLGVGTPAAMAAAGTSAPLVGFLTDRGLLESGASVSLAGWVKPAAEPEVAVHVGEGLTVAGLGPAIELVDLDVPMSEVEAVLAGDIFHRHVLLGPSVPGEGEGAGLRGEVRLGDSAPQSQPDPLSAGGRPEAAVEHVAALLGAFGEQLRAGEVIITGSIVPALAVEPGQRLDYALDPLGALSVAFR